MLKPQLNSLVLLQGLAQYGNGFLAKFEAASCANKLLEEVTLVDTPGVLSGEKQRIERTYNFIDVCGWFAARCDLILLLFDPHKLDISDEFKQVRGCELSHGAVHVRIVYTYMSHMYMLYCTYLSCTELLHNGLGLAQCEYEFLMTCEATAKIYVSSMSALLLQSIC